MYLLRETLNCEQLSVTVLDVDAGWDGRPHDHAADEHEEVYLLINGASTLTVDGDRIALEPGDAVRVDPDAKRSFTFDADSTMVIR